MRRALPLLLAVLSASALAAAPVPAIDAPVTDLAGVLSAAQVTALSEQLTQHRAQRGVQLAVLLVDTTGDEPIEDYALRAAVAWGGGERRKDDGALFVMAVKDRRMRLELGYGLEALVPDAVAATVLEELKPFLRDSNYDGAMAHLVTRLRDLTAPGVAAPPAAPARSPFLPQDLRELLEVVDVPWVFTLVAALFLGRALRRRFDWHKGVQLSEGLRLSVPQTIVALAVLVGVFAALFGLLGFGWGLWWPATQGLLVGAFALHDAEPFSWLLYAGALGIATLVMQLAWSVPLDQLLFAAIAQAAVGGVSILASFPSEGGGSSYGSSGVSWASRSSSRSSFGSSSSSFGSSSSSFGSSRSSSSSSSSGSRSSGGYRGGGGSFGGGGASSSW